MIRVRRVYWWSDWMHSFRLWLREGWRLIFGCHHKWETVRFQHVKEGTWAVNECRKCGEQHVHGVWAMPYSNKGKWR